MTNQFTLHLPPVVERELRVAARKGSIYWSRTAAAIAGIVVISFVLMGELTRTPVLLGQTTFRVLGGMTGVIVLMSVVQSAAEAFAREKREDTLGLLFLTPLRSADIALGKLASTSLGAFYQFLAVVPMLAIPILAGGVSAPDFVLLVIGLVNLIFVAATLGLWVSALCWDEKRAASWASSTMMALVLVPGVIAIGMANGGSSREFEAIGIFSPAFTIVKAVQLRTGGTLTVLASIAWTQLLGWSFFLFACRALPRCWQKRPESVAPKADHLQPGKSISSTFAANSKEGNTRPRKLTRRQFSREERAALLNRNPLAWFAMRWKPPASGTWALVVIAAIGYVPALVAGVSANEWGLLFAPGYALVIMFFVNMGIKTFAAHQASFTFARDRGEDTLELLLSTPNSARDLIDGHAHALRELLRPLLRRALWIEGAWFAATIAIHVGQHGRDTFLYAFAGAAMLGLLAPDTYALMWTAMWQSVISRNARQAQQQTFSDLAVLPWLMIAVPVGLGGIIGGGSGALVALIVSWVVGSTLADRYYSSQSRRRLEAHLVLWALRRAAGDFEHYDGWKNLGRRLGRWWALRSAPAPRLTSAGR